MVKLFGISLLYKAVNNVTCLKSVFDLQSFGYFQRNTIKEFMEFTSKIVVERGFMPSRQSVKEGEYMCHAYIRNDGLGGVIISDLDYPTRVAHTLLNKILEDFVTKVPQNVWTTAKPVTYSGLEIMLEKYQNPQEADALTKIQNELDETKIILHNTIEAVLQRGEKLDDLVAKSEMLSLQSKTFYKTAKKTNSCCNYG